MQSLIEKIKNLHWIPEHFEENKYSIEIVINTFQKYLKQNAKILDWGAGWGSHAGCLSQFGFNISATDDFSLSKKIMTESLMNNLQQYATSCNFKYFKPKNSLWKQQNYYDAILLNGVIEHFHYSPKNTINELLSYLKKDGLLMINVPNAGNIRKRFSLLFGKTNLPNFEDFYNTEDFYEGHIREYVREDLTKLTKIHNMAIVELRGIDCMLEKVPYLLKIPYLKLTNLFNGLKDTWMLLARKNN